MRGHERWKAEQAAAREKEREENRQKRASRNEELKQRVEETKQKKKDSDGGVKEPPFMDFIMNFLGGLKIEVKRIHIRYEDDYFNHTRPFSFGFMIDHILLDNSDVDWIFESPMSVNISKRTPE
jgi:hypothetical protein